MALKSSFSYSVLPAISLESGFLHCEVVEGSFRADTFALFIQNLLEHMEPFLGMEYGMPGKICRFKSLQNA